MSTNADDLPEEVVNTLDGLANYVNEIEGILSPFFEKQDLDEYYSKLSPLEVSRLNILMCFAMNTLFYVFLKTQGVDPALHPVMKEIGRVKEYIGKLRQVQLQEKETGPKNRIDVAAANRFIEHGIGKKRKPEESPENIDVDIVHKKPKEKKEEIIVEEESNSMNVETPKKKSKRTPEERAAKKARKKERELRKSAKK